MQLKDAESVNEFLESEEHKNFGFCPLSSGKCFGYECALFQDAKDDSDGRYFEVVPAKCLFLDAIKKYLKTR